MTHNYICKECDSYVVCHGENIIACLLGVCSGCLEKNETLS